MKSLSLLSSASNKRPKILIFAPRIREGVVGGVATYTSNIMNSEDMNQRFDLSIIDLEEVTIKPTLWFRLLNRFYMHLIRWNKSKTIILERRASRAESELKKVRPDVVICFFSNSDHFFWLMGRISEVACSIGVKFIADYHAGGFGVFWNSLSRRNQMAARQVLQNAHLILVRNDPAVRFFNDIVPDATVKKLFNPVQCDFFTTSKTQETRKFNNSNIQLAFVGVSSPYNKGAFLLADAIGQVLSKVPNLSVVMAGPDRQNFAAALKRMPMNVQRVINLTGGLLPEAVRDLFRQSDIFVIPSYSEGFSIALLEAMSCGLACIGTSVGAIPEVLNYGKAGLLFDPGNAVQLASAIERLATDDVLRKQLGNAARRKVETQYTLTSFEHCFADLLNDVIGENEVINGR